MGLDRLVYFKGTSAPTLAEVRAACLGYFGPDAKVEVDTLNNGFGTLIFLMPMKASGPFDGEMGIKRNGKGVHNPHRYVEVYMHGPDGGSQDDRLRCVNVETRRADEFTHAVADGVVGFLVRAWKGRRERDELPSRKPAKKKS